MAEGLFWGLFYKSTDSIHEATFAKPYVLIGSPWALGFPHVNWAGGRHECSVSGKPIPQYLDDMTLQQGQQSQRQVKAQHFDFSFSHYYL